MPPRGFSEASVFLEERIQARVAAVPGICVCTEHAWSDGAVVPKSLAESLL